MSVAYQVVQTDEKKQEIIDFLKDNYWNNDIWNIKDPIFDDLRPKKLKEKKWKLNFTLFCDLIKTELKYMFARELIDQRIGVYTVLTYKRAFKNYAEFLNKYYPQINSIVELPYEKAVSQWKLFLTDKGFKITRTTKKGKTSFNEYIIFMNIFHSFFMEFYDLRNEYEKDIWDCRKIPGIKITNTSSTFKLDFTPIPLIFRGLVKGYIKALSKNKTVGHCYKNVLSLRKFFDFIHKKEPIWNDLRKLKRKHIEAYICFAKEHAEGTTTVRYGDLTGLKNFLEYIERAQYDEAPKTPAACLIFKEDIPRRGETSENDVKYIQLGVLQQLEESWENISPIRYIPVVILLRASGWRISDIFNLRYDTCLKQTEQGWYLCGDIKKTQVLNHRVPITEEIQRVVAAAVEETIEKSTDDNNPEHLLFVQFTGPRKGLCPLPDGVRDALNRLAEDYDITDDQGNIFYFKNHAFRHTKGVELINNGMNILHVQKWLAHQSPGMTQAYAKVLDTTMRKSWEEASGNGLFRPNRTGEIEKMELSEIKDEDVIEWEYIRNNLDAVRMPLGYCLKPRKQECRTQMNPCLTCRNLCTSPDFISEYEHEIQETKVLIEHGKRQGHKIWVVKNENLLQRYEDALSVLKDGKTRHKAGKKGREYMGEEKINMNTKVDE